MKLDVLFTGILFAFSFSAVVVILYVFSRREKTPGVNIIGALFCANLLYSLGYALELISSDPGYKMMFNHIQYCGIPFIAPLWFMLSVQFMKKDFRWSVRQLLPLMILPLCTVLANFTYAQNGLLYTSHSLETWNGISVIVFHKGIWYTIHCGYQNLLTALTFLNFCRTLRLSRGIERRQSVLLVVLSALGLALTLLCFLPTLTSKVDFVSILISCASILFFATLFKYELFELLPFAYYNVFELADNPIMILNDTLCLVKANKAAYRFFRSEIRDGYYVPVERIFSKYPNFVQTLKRKQCYAFQKRVGGNTLFFRVTLTSLIMDRKKSRNDFGFLLTFYNETTHVAQVHDLEQAASIDPLTGAFNRRYFFSAARSAAEKAKSANQPFSVIMLDIDHFKNINDSFGHQAGDSILKSIAGIARAQLRKSDIFARYGGEEFIALLPGAVSASAEQTARRICAAIEQTDFSHHGKSIRITVSAGVSGTSGKSGQSLENAIELSDSALYRAKEAGRNRVCIENPPDGA